MFRGYHISTHTMQTILDTLAVDIPNLEPDLDPRAQAMVVQIRDTLQNLPEGRQLDRAKVSNAIAACGYIDRQLDDDKVNIFDYDNLKAAVAEIKETLEDHC